MIKLFKKDHTDQSLTTWQWICANSDQIEKQNKILQQTDLQKIPLLLELNHNFDLKTISKDIEIAKQKYGDWGWLSENNPDGKNKPYSGFGLTWNPDHNLKLPEHQSVLGSPDRNKFTYDVSKSDPHGELFGNGKNAGVRDSAPEATCDAGSSFVRRMAVRVRVSNPAPSPLTSHRLASSSSIARGELTNINPPLPAHSLPNRKRKRKRRSRRRRSLQFSQGRAPVSRRTYEALPQEGRLRPPCRWRRGCLHGCSHGVS